MVPPRARQGPTVRTLRAIEKVLRDAGIPQSRYQIRKELGTGIAPRLLDEALAYMAEHGMVYDEGTGGTVVWVRTPARTRRKLRRSA